MIFTDYLNPVIFRFFIFTLNLPFIFSNRDHNFLEPSSNISLMQATVFTSLCMWFLTGFCCWILGDFFEFEAHVKVFEIVINAPLQVLESFLFCIRSLEPLKLPEIETMGSIFVRNSQPLLQGDHLCMKTEVFLLAQLLSRKVSHSSYTNYQRNQAHRVWWK